jgi:hypothetical protein
VVPAELRQINAVPGSIDPTQNDILVMSANGIQYRAMRGLGTLCQAPTSTELRVYNAPASPWSGYRDPEGTRDGVYVFIENNENKSSDDVWQQAQISSVATGNVCGGQPGFRLTIDPAVPALATAGVNAPVRTYEVMQLQLYQSGGEWWLGAQSVSAGEVMQPMLGPLRAADGLVLDYFNAAGGITADPKAVRVVQVTIHGLTDQKVVSGTGTRKADVGDSLVTRVVLRNALR